MSNARMPLVIGGAVLLIAAGGLWFMLQDGGSADKQAAPGRGPVATVEPQASTPDRPTMPAEAVPAEAVPTETTPVTEYVVGDRRVRDHRTGNHAPLDLPPAIHPPEGRKIPSTLTHAIGQQVRAKVAACAASIPTEARGDRPRVEGLVVISIKDKQVVVTSATMQVRNVVGDSVGPTKQCIEAGALAVTNPTDEADLDKYDLTLSFAL